MKISTAKKLVKAWEIVKIVFAICIVLIVLIGVISLFVHCLKVMLVITATVGLLIGTALLDAWWRDVVVLSNREDNDPM